VLTINEPDISPHVLAVLEAVEFRWTILDVLEQPQAILDDVLMLKSVGQKLARMRKNAG
jgi:hypothetical protein